MTREIFEKAIAFSDRIGFPMVQISGGEPTEHPELISFLDFVRGVFASLKGKSLCGLLSNGLFLEDRQKAEEILKRVDLVQVTNDPRFYPRSSPIVKHPKIVYETRLRALTLLGRAAKNKMTGSGHAPQCFNLRSATRRIGNLHEAQAGNFHEAVIFLRSKGLYCTPSINIDGSISAGESPLCTKIGTVDDDFSTIGSNLCRMTCNNCGGVDNLNHQLKLVIGETSIITL
jgi:hypothetical protein